MSIRDYKYRHHAPGDIVLVIVPVVTGDYTKFVAAEMEVSKVIVTQTENSHSLEYVFEGGHRAFEFLVFDYRESAKRVWGSFGGWVCSKTELMECIERR